MTKRHLLFLPLIAVLVMLVLSACAAPPPRENSARRSPAPTVSPAILMNDDRPPQLQRLTESWNTDWTRHTIRYDEILSGGPPRDGIPAIDDPKFVTIDAAAGWLQEQEPVQVSQQPVQAQGQVLEGYSNFSFPHIRSTLPALPERQSLKYSFSS